MKKIYLALSLLIFVACTEYQGTYTFTVINNSSHTIHLLFSESSTYTAFDAEFEDSVAIAPGEEQIVRVIFAPDETPVSDCLETDSTGIFNEMLFSAYIDTMQLDSTPWQQSDWKYLALSDWAASYTLTIDSLEVENMLP